eukprot:4856769-Prorocentrum_lima.AAC.1
MAKGHKHRFAKLKEEVAEGCVLIKDLEDRREDDGRPRCQKRSIVSESPQLGFGTERVLDKAEEEISHRGKKQRGEGAPLPNTHEGLEEVSPRGTHMLKVVVVEELEEVDPSRGEPQVPQDTPHT